MKEKDLAADKIMDMVSGRAAAWFGEGILEKLRLFASEQARWSRKMHLVSRGRLEETIARQIVDSLMMLRFARKVEGRIDPAGKGSPDDCRILDIGAGFGFPGIVWKIADGSLKMTLVERKEKAAVFLELLVARTGLDRIDILLADAGRDEIPGRFGLVVSKAAGRLGTLLPLAADLLDEGGAYITIKEKDWEWELEEAQDSPMKCTAREEIPGRRGFLLAFS